MRTWISIVAALGACTEQPSPEVPAQPAGPQPVAEPGASDEDPEAEATRERVRARLAEEQKRTAEKAAPTEALPPSRTGDGVLDKALEGCEEIRAQEPMRDGWLYLPNTCGGKRFGCTVHVGHSAASRALHYLCDQAGGRDSRDNVEGTGASGLSRKSREADLGK